MDNVIDFLKYKNSRKIIPVVQSYSDRLVAMDKLDLLTEMAQFFKRKEEATPLSSEECLNAIALFQMLSGNAETDELKQMAKKCYDELSTEYKNAYPVA